MTLDIEQKLTDILTELSGLSQDGGETESLIERMQRVKEHWATRS